MEQHYTYDPDHEHWVFTFNEWKMSWRYSARTHNLTQAEEKFQAEVDGLAESTRLFESHLIWGNTDLWFKDPTTPVGPTSSSIPARIKPPTITIPIEIMAACFVASQP